MEICPDDRIHTVILTIPGVGSPSLSLPFFMRDRAKHFVQRLLLIEGFVIQEHFAGMMFASHAVKPIAIDQVGIRIIITEKVFGIVTFQTPSFSFVQPVILSEPFISTFLPEAAR